MLKNLFFMISLLVPGSVSADFLQLKAANAVIHGDNIAYESRSSRDCIGSWENVSATVKWEIEFKNTGTVSISAVQAAMSSSAGNRIRFLWTASLLMERLRIRAIGERSRRSSWAV